MARLAFIACLLIVGKWSVAQTFHSDHNTPLIEITPCNCSSWHSPYVNVDSTRKKLKEVNYQSGGKRYKRTYYLTIIDSTWTDVCDQPLNCAKTTRTRVTNGYRTWYTDITSDVKLLSFTLPCCSDKPVTIKDIAKVQMDGRADLVFSPATLSVPTLPYSTQNVTVSANGQSLTASITMINPDAKIAGNNAELEKIKKLNDLANDKFKPVLNKANNLLNRHLSYLGEWNSQVKLNFKFGGEANQICCPDKPECVQTSYKIFGDGEAGLLGKVGIPVAGLPVIGKYLGGSDVAVTLGASVALNVSGKTTCTNNEICTTGDGKVTGGGSFALKAAGFKAEGQVVVEGGGMSGELCLWPQVEMKCVKLNTGKLKLVGSVEDKWGWTHWDVEYVLWNGFTVPLYDCQK